MDLLEVWERKVSHGRLYTPRMTCWSTWTRPSTCVRTREDAHEHYIRLAHTLSRQEAHIHKVGCHCLGCFFALPEALVGHGDHVKTEFERRAGAWK